MKNIAHALAFITTLSCAAVKPPPTSPVQGVGSETAIATVENVQLPPREKVRQVLEVLGEDLCTGVDSGEVGVAPFTLSRTEVLAHLDVDPFTSAAWRFPKKMTYQDVERTVSMFASGTQEGLPSCYSFYALRDGLGQLTLPEKIKQRIDECLNNNEPDIKTNMFSQVEKAMRKGGESTPLSVCISHYGGDYAYPNAKLSNNVWTVAPSCWETVAASHFGYSMNAQSPYAEYNERERMAVIATRNCVQTVISTK